MRTILEDVLLDMLICQTKPGTGALR